MKTFSKYFLFIVPIVGLLFTVQALFYFGVVIGYSRDYESLSVFEKIVLITGLAGFFAFWFGMLVHFFSNQKLKHRVIWGLSLFFLTWLSSLIYFFTYFMRDVLAAIRSKEHRGAR
jgi:hypothetical protein